MYTHVIPRSAAQRRVLLAALVLIAATPALATAMPIDAQAQARALLAGPVISALSGAALSKPQDSGPALEPQQQAQRLLAGPRSAPSRRSASTPIDAAINPARRLILGKDA
jgi:hypothetical protein